MKKFTDIINESINNINIGDKFIVMDNLYIKNIGNNDITEPEKIMNTSEFDNYITNLKNSYEKFIKGDIFTCTKNEHDYANNLVELTPDNNNQIPFILIGSDIVNLYFRKTII